MRRSYRILAALTAALLLILCLGASAEQDVLEVAPLEAAEPADLGETVESADALEGLEPEEAPEAQALIPDGEVVANAASDDFEIKDGVLVAYKGAGGVVVIPDGVKAIGDWAFSNNETLTDVVIPEGVTAIGEQAFSYCYELVSVSVPDSVRSIGEYAFGDSVRLKDVRIPEGVKSIGHGTFTGTAITEMVVPEGVTAIGSMAFQGCSQLKRVVLPGTLKTIGEEAFWSCEALETLPLPDGLTGIDDFAFCWCTGLKSMAIPEGVKRIGSSAFEGCLGLKELTIPASVKSIGKGNFVYWDDEDDGLKLLPKLTIYGYKGSCAEDFAKNGYAEADDFVDPAAKVIPFRALIDKAKVTAPAQAYTGKALKPEVTVKLGKAALTAGTDYKVSYKNNKKVGRATVTVKGIGDYAGTATGTFAINPKAVSGLKLTAGKKQLTVSWKKSAGVGGYQLQYGLKKSAAGAKKVTVKKAATVKKVLKKLATGKKVWVRVRAYQKVDGVTLWSEWSAWKGAKVK